MVDAHAVLVLTPLLGLLVDCACHVVVSRCLTSWSLVGRLFAGVVAGLVAVIATCSVAVPRMGIPGGDECAILALDLGTYLALAYGYVGYVSMNLTSLRIHVLKLLLESGGSLPRQRLLSLYNTDEVVASRLADLLKGGYLVERGGRLHTGKPTILIIAVVWDFMRRVALGRNCPSFPSLPATRAPSRTATEQ